MHKGFVSDLRIIDISQGVAGPLASKLLADQGAEVIKVEPPEGDYSRRYAPFASDAPDPEQSLTYAFFNTSKKGVTLDVGTPDGAELLTENGAPLRRSDRGPAAGRDGRTGTGLRSPVTDQTRASSSSL